MLAQYGVHRAGLPGVWPTGWDDAVRAVHPGLAGIDHRGERVPGRPGRAGVRAQRRGIRRPVDDHHGRRDLPVVPRRRDLPGDPGDADPDRVDGPERRRLGALRRPGEVPADHRVGDHGGGHRLGAAAAADDRHRLLVHPHRPVALRRLPRGRAVHPARPRPVRRQTHHGRARRVGGDGLDAVLPAVRPQQPRPRRRGRRRRNTGAAVRCAATGLGRPEARRHRTGRPEELAAGADRVAGEPARLVQQGQRVLPAAPAGHHPDQPAGRRRPSRSCGRTTSPGPTTFPRASST